MERMMKLQDVLLKAMAKRITWWEAAEIIGVTDRTMRRWRERLEEHGYSGLADRRKGKVSVPIGDGGNPSPSGEARSSKSPKGTSYPPTEVGGFKNEAGALNRIQFDAPAVTPRLEAGGCLV